MPHGTVYGLPMAGTGRLQRERAPRKQDDKERSTLVEIVGIVVVALALAFFIQLLLVNRIGTHFGDPSVGDVVVFHPPAGADQPPPVCGASGEGTGSSRPCSTP